MNQALAYAKAHKVVVGVGAALVLVAAYILYRRRAANKAAAEYAAVNYPYGTGPYAATTPPLGAPAGDIVLSMPLATSTARMGGAPPASSGGGGGGGGGAAAPAGGGGGAAAATQPAPTDPVSTDTYPSSPEGTTSGTTTVATPTYTNVTDISGALQGVDLTQPVALPPPDAITGAMTDWSGTAAAITLAGEQSLAAERLQAGQIQRAPIE